MLGGTPFGLEIVHRRHRWGINLADYRPSCIVDIAPSNHHFTGDDKEV